MTSRLSRVLVLCVLSAVLVGCRQPDGPAPVADGEVPNRLADIGRDLSSVSRGDAQARQDLADDLAVFLPEDSQSRAVVDELSNRTATVVAGRELNEQTAQRIAHHLWMATAAHELSQRQVETLQNDYQALLVSIGVPEEQATGVAAQVGEVQKSVTLRPRRWYEFF